MAERKTVDGVGVTPEARDERVDRLRHGAQVWNSFRREHSEFINLNFVLLTEAALEHADLHKVFFLESDLSRANLMSARLDGAILRKANFADSNLRHAVMDGADLYRADLSGADLRDASLAGAFLKCADLRGADLSTARGLTAAQIGEAVGDARTRLPPGIPYPAGWLERNGARGPL
jgi:uncharacterized protein YjbI with pentapeptide repeats